MITNNKNIGKLKMFLISLCILVVIITLITFCFLRSEKQIKTKKIINSINIYLNNNENFRSDIIKDVILKYDKKAEMYIATITFENNSKNLNMLINENGKIKMPKSNSNEIVLKKVITKD